jgi:hypothetical protein
MLAESTQRVFWVRTNSWIFLYAERLFDLLQRGLWVEIAAVVSCQVLCVYNDREQIMHSTAKIVNVIRQRANETLVKVDQVCEEVVPDQNRSSDFEQCCSSVEPGRKICFIEENGCASVGIFGKPGDVDLRKAATCHGFYYPSEASLTSNLSPNLPSPLLLYGLLMLFIEGLDGDRVMSAYGDKPWVLFADQLVYYSLVEGRELRKGAILGWLVS